MSAGEVERLGHAAGHHRPFSTNEVMNELIDGLIDGLINGLIDELIDELIDGLIDNYRGGRAPRARSRASRPVLHD